MHCLIVYPESGEAKQCGEEELTQEDLLQIDESTADIFAWDEVNKRFLRAAVSDSDRGDGNRYNPVWSPV